MNSTTTNNQEYFKQEENAAMWSPSSPSDVSSPSNSVSDQDYNVYHVPRGYDVLLVPMKVEPDALSDSTCSPITDSPVESPVEPTSSSKTKPMDIPKSKSPSSTNAKASAAAAAATATTTTRLSAYRKRKADKNYIPRPKNCFMAYREHIKEKFLSEDPGMNNKVVSVLAANMWNNEPEDVKEYWRERAKQLKLEHKLKYPDYKFKPQKKKQNLKTTANPKTSTKATGARNNNKKSNSDTKIIFADGYGSEILGENNHQIGLEGCEEQDDIYLTHLQKKTLFGHYRASSVDSVSSWTSDSTASTPLLSPFVGSPASLSPPTFQFGNQFGRSSSALRYEAGNIVHNEGPSHSDLMLSHNMTSQSMLNEVEQLNSLYSNQLDINASLPVDDGFVLDSYETPMIKTSTAVPSFFNSPQSGEISSTDYDLMAMGHYTASPVQEQGEFFHDYENSEPSYPSHVYSSSFELSSQGNQSTLSGHYAYALGNPRRNSHQLLADFQHGLKQQEMMLQGLLME
ncbi:7221_t:CDS:1 [Funneliformis geosporum]|uniref:7230_t:CDS:1 n=1 Tax=Funneliformis geosporum TaxID=1117311 RepID=A0A9W4STT9_9GLOM|nr:7221_t:CDS:1 [Funneliformis geosporum]CAI2181103.1 7230_t:CDS:1 [Funneliformis geosporum]